MKKWVLGGLAAIVVFVGGGAAAVINARTPGGLLGVFSGGPEAPARTAPLQAQAQVGGEVERRDFGDWLLACPQGNEAASNCVILQNHVAGNGERRLFLIQLRPAEEGSFEAAMLAPIGVRLQSGIVLEIEGLSPSRVAFSHCQPAECHASVRISGDAFAQLLEADAARARFQMNNGQNVEIAISLNGLADAAEALRQN